MQQQIDDSLSLPPAPLSLSLSKKVYPWMETKPPPAEDMNLVRSLS